MKSVTKSKRKSTPPRVFTVAPPAQVQNLIIRNQTFLRLVCSGGAYAIKFCDIDSMPKLLETIHHLCGLPGITPAHIEQLIAVMIERN